MDNAVIDVLSRIEMNAFPPQVDLVVMAKAQHTLKFILTILTLSNIPVDDTITCDTSTGVKTFCVSNPSPYCLTPSPHCSTLEQVQPSILSQVRPNVNRDVRRWKRANIQQHMVTPLSAFIPPDA